MLKQNLEKLIRTLSPSERRSFRLNHNRHTGVPDYLVLFDIICENQVSGDTSIEGIFKERFPAKSFVNTATYLYKVLIDMLVQIRIDQDQWFLRHQSLMKAKVCFERSIPEMGIKELKKAQKLSTDTQDYLVHYSSLRMELSALSDAGFQELSEPALIEMQMSAKRKLLDLQHLQEHQSLYELLRHRLNNNHLAFTQKGSDKVNDLILAELSLSTVGRQHQFESKKLHLLFQSFFFICSREYHSALKAFKELNQLLEENECRWNNPPYDYLATLDGILDSLRSIKYYDEMRYFIAKAESLNERELPEHFRIILGQTIQVYYLTYLTGKLLHNEAISFVQSIKEDLLRKEGGSNEKQAELLFFAAVSFFTSGKWQKAIKYIVRGIELSGNNYDSPLCRVCRLLNILICYELDDIEYLNYQVRAYKRAFIRQGKLLLTERLVFSTISLDPKRCGIPKKRQAEKKMMSLLGKSESDKQEQQLLKYFNFIDWVKSKY